MSHESFSSSSFAHLPTNGHSKSGLRVNLQRVQVWVAKVFPSSRRRCSRRFPKSSEHRTCKTPDSSQKRAFITDRHRSFPWFERVSKLIWDFWRSNASLVDHSTSQGFEFEIEATTSHYNLNQRFGDLCSPWLRTQNSSSLSSILEASGKAYVFADFWRISRLGLNFGHLFAVWPHKALHMERIVGRRRVCSKCGRRYSGDRFGQRKGLAINDEHDGGQGQTEGHDRGDWKIVWANQSQGSIK